MAQRPAVTSPNMGLVFDRPKINIPSRGISDGFNFRVKNGTLESLNLGWTKFSPNFTLNGSVLLINNFFPANLDEKLIFATATELYLYDPVANNVTYLTPTYVTGTAAATGTAVTGIGTTWLANVKAGDQIHFGSATETSPTATWFVIDAVPTNTLITLHTSAGSVANGPYTIRRRFQAAVDAAWDADVFVHDGDSGDDLWIATNGLDFPVSWNGSDMSAKLHPELQFTCKSLATFSNMMIYGNVSQSGDDLFSTIINSDVGFPLHAGATASGISEQFIVHSHTDAILTLVTIADYLIAYCERTIVPIQFVGDPLIFAFRVAISGYGPISPNAVADFGDYHEFLGADAGYIFDGVTLKETNSHVWRDILRQSDPIRRRESYCHFDEEQGDLIWVVPNNADPDVGVVGGAPSLAWVEHYLETVADPTFTGKPFSKRKFPFTATGHYQRSTGSLWSDMTFAWTTANYAWNDQFFQAAYPYNLSGDANGDIWIFNTSQLANGAQLPSFVHTGRWALTSGRERDLFTRAYPFAHTMPFNLEVTLYMGDSVGGDVINKGTAIFNQQQPEGGHFVTFYRRGRVCELEFGSSIGDPWVIDGYDYDSVKGGRR